MLILRQIDSPSKEIKKISIPIVTSHALEKNNNETEYLIIMIHGGGLNAVNTFETGQKLIESLKICSEK